jgi:ankyrin repeat protein
VPKKAMKLYEVCNYLLEVGAKPDKEALICIFHIMVDINFDAGIKLLKLFLDYGANVNSFETPGHGYGLLTMAIEQFSELKDGSKRVVKLLMEYGVNPELNNFPPYETPLMTAIKDNKIDLCRLLIEYGADLTVKDGSNSNVMDHLYLKDVLGKIGNLILSDFHSKYPSIHLYDHPRKTHKKTAKRETDETKQEKEIELFKIVRNYEQDKDASIKICALLESGVDVNCSNEEGDTPLHFAETSSSAKALLKYGADITLKNNNGYTVLYSAVSTDVPQNIRQYAWL